MELIACTASQVLGIIKDAAEFVTSFQRNRNVGSVLDPGAEVVVAQGRAVHVAVGVCWIGGSRGLGLWLAGDGAGDVGAEGR